MAKAKSPEEERQIILSQPAKRPYGAALSLHVQTAAAFGQVEQTEIILPTGAFVTLVPARMAPWEGGRKYLMKLEGFSTAAATEAAAWRLVQAVLWMAVSTDAPLRLDYQSYDPFAVFDRTRSGGAQLQAYGEIYFPPARVFGEITEAFGEMGDPDPAVLLSMEIFASARLEASDRARFLLVVSALEPLAQGQSLGESAQRFVETCLEKLTEVSELAPELRSSLAGRLRQLCSESIRQALRRVARQALPSRPEAVHALDAAYSLRSEIVHSGRPSDLDVDLEQEIRLVSSLLHS